MNSTALATVETSPPKGSRPGGEFVFTGVACGEYTILGHQPGHFNGSMPVLWNSKQVSMMLTPTVPAGQIRVVMSWGKSPPAPKDLDIHCIFKATPKQLCSVSWARRSCGGTFLDIDDTRGGQYGAETMTIKTLRQAVYVFFMENYSAHPGTEDSAANFKVYTAAGMLLEVPMPPPVASSYASPPPGGYLGQYVEQSRWMRALCIDARGATPIVRAIALYMADKPTALESCTV